MAALRAEFDLSVDEAWDAYRRVRDAIVSRYHHAPGYVDLDRHPRIVSAEVRTARIAFATVDADETIDDVKISEERQRKMLADERLDEFGVPFAVEEDEYEEFELTATTKGYTPRRSE